MHQCFYEELVKVFGKDVADLRKTLFNYGTIYNIILEFKETTPETKLVMEFISKQIEKTKMEYKEKNFK